jgi:propanol-preferring alcohol dehydrogenase
MVLHEPRPIDREPLQLEERPAPEPRRGEVLVKVAATAVCRTDLHVVEGELSAPKPVLVPGHQIVGRVEALGEDVSDVSVGDRIGIPWLGGVCGRCPYCRSQKENLCDRPDFTGYTLDGGYAEYAVARAAFTFPIPPSYEDSRAAPLLCAGMIGFRSLRLAEVEPLSGPGRLGLFGFGSSAQIVIQVARHQGLDVYVYTRGEAGRQKALELGAVWAGGGEDLPPVELDSVIIFAPSGALVPLALKSLRKGGVAVCAGIHMSAIPGFDYELLWGERVLRSVANLTRADGREFFELASRLSVKTEVHEFALEEANEALRRHKAGELAGTAVLVPN